MITSQLQISKHQAGRSLIFGRAESAVASPDSDSLSGAFHDKLETTADSERTINDHLSIYTWALSEILFNSGNRLYFNTIILRREIYETRPVEEDV